jgi:hypothetical protein
MLVKKSYDDWKLFTGHRMIQRLLHATSLLCDGDVNKPLFERVLAYAEVLGKPAYHVTYEDRMAVWGFEILGTGVIIYYSNRGLVVQMEEVDREKAWQILWTIHRRIIGTAKMSMKTGKWFRKTT